jgi:hypothetical protein
LGAGGRAGRWLLLWFPSLLVSVRAFLLRAHGMAIPFLAHAKLHPGRLDYYVTRSCICRPITSAADLSLDSRKSLGPALVELDGCIHTSLDLEVCSGFSHRLSAFAGCLCSPRICLRLPPPAVIGQLICLGRHACCWLWAKGKMRERKGRGLKLTPATATSSRPSAPQHKLCYCLPASPTQFPPHTTNSLSTTNL